MVYCKTETNLCPLGQRCGNALLIKGVSCTSAFRQMVLAFMTIPPLLSLWSPEARSFISSCIEEMVATRRSAVAVLSMFPRLA